MRTQRPNARKAVTDNDDPRPVGVKIFQEQSEHPWNLSDFLSE